MKKKPYSAPVIKSEPIKVGVFGDYGNPSPKFLPSGKWQKQCS